MDNANFWQQCFITSVVKIPFCQCVPGGYMLRLAAKNG